MIDLIHLAAQTENDRRRHVGMVQDAGQRALQLLGIGADGMAAAFAVRKRRHAIHVGRQRFVLKAGRDQLGGVRRAVAGRHHGDVVARPYPAVLAPIAEKCRNVLAGPARRAISPAGKS